MIFEINGVEWHVEFVAPGSNLLSRIHMDVKWRCIQR